MQSLGPPAREGGSDRAPWQADPPCRTAQLVHAGASARVVAAEPSNVVPCPGGLTLPRSAAGRVPWRLEGPARILGSFG